LGVAPPAGANAGVEEFALHLVAAAAVVGLSQVGVEKGCLGVLVEASHVGVGWHAIQVKVILLHVLVVVALAESLTGFLS
jgi:hypothetical protein